MSRRKGKPGRRIEKDELFLSERELRGGSMVPEMKDDGEARDFILVSASDAFRLVLELMDSDAGWSEKHELALQAQDALMAVAETCVAMAGREALEEEK